MITTRVSFNTYVEHALENDAAPLELVDGEMREKPGMAAEHNDLLVDLLFIIGRQIDRQKYRLRINSGRVQRSETTAFIPDLFVIPIELERPQRQGPGHLEMYEPPLPLIVEAWSRSTGDYDVMTKLPVYNERGDAEIWLLHPYERTLVTWVRQPDGAYLERTYRDGDVVELSAIPGVTVDLGELFQL